MTYVKFIILPHLSSKLFLDPLPHSRTTLAIEPTELLYLSHDPPFLALLGEDPPKAQIIHATPERKVDEEEHLRCTPRKKHE
jgi:hypothetical protein